MIESPPFIGLQYHALICTKTIFIPFLIHVFSQGHEFLLAPFVFSKPLGAWLTDVVCASLNYQLPSIKNARDFIPGVFYSVNLLKQMLSVVNWV